MSEWREVRRKSKPSEKPFVSFYICDLPGDVFKKELWAPCATFGKLIDIYIAGRKNAAGSFFAFIRYEDPADPISIASSLNNVMCRGKKIVANIARQPRPSKQPPPRIPPPRSRTVQNMAWSTQDSRSFADALGGKTQVVPAMAIPVKEVAEIKTWADNSVLVCEAKDFDTLCNFPALINHEGFHILEVKYKGGMQILIKFNTGKAADMFKINKNIWLKWFSKVEHLVNNSANFERIAWLKIIGLPMEAWDENSFSDIASKFGKVLVNNASFWNCSDLSQAKIGILTTSLKRLEGVMMIKIGGADYSIGVLEIVNDWSPFSPASFPASDSEEEEDRDGEGDEEISDTFEHMDTEREDGEFIPGDDANFPANGNSGQNNNPQEDLQSTHLGTGTRADYFNDGTIPNIPFTTPVSDRDRDVTTPLVGVSEPQPISPHLNIMQPNLHQPTL